MMTQANTIAPGDIAAVEYFVETNLANLEHKVNAWLKASPHNAYSIISSQFVINLAADKADQRFVHVITYVVHNPDQEGFVSPNNNQPNAFGID